MGKFCFQNTLFDVTSGETNPDKMSFPEIYNTLNEEQKSALELLASGENIFITGNAGTGKSYLVKAFDKYCEHENISLMKTAPTGVASLEIGGATLHSQFGLKVGLDFEKPTKIPDCLRKVDCLLIDEISMVRLDIFDKLMEIIELANKKRKKEIQLVFVGDFYQLAPVITNKDKPFLDKHYGTDIKGGYCFQSLHWRKNNIHLFNLTTVMRQEDAAFCDALDKCKKGNATCLPFLRNQSSQEEIADAIWVCGKNATVSQHNDKELDKLSGRVYISNAEYEGKASPNDRLCDEIFQFKIGARVVMLVNDTEKKLYQNGSLGTITDVKKDEIFVQIDNGEEVKIHRIKFSKYEYVLKKDTKISRTEIGSAKQYPMRLGYAVTVHKSQGQTYPKMNLEPEIFSNGQLYVALSRCKSIEKIFIHGYISKRMVLASDDVISFYNDSENYSFFSDDSNTASGDIQEENADNKEPTVSITIPQKHYSAVMKFLDTLRSS